MKIEGFIFKVWPLSLQPHAMIEEETHIFSPSQIKYHNFHIKPFRLPSITHSSCLNKDNSHQNSLKKHISQSFSDFA